MKVLKLLSNLIRIPSEFPHEKEIGDYLYKYLKSFGYTVAKVRTSTNRVNLVAWNRNSDNFLGLYGHIDTVARDEEGRNPYMLDVKRNRAYGLGAVDMKGAIAAMLVIAEFALSKNIPVKFVFGVDEENISQGAHDLVNSGLLSDIGFLIVGESGQIRDIHKPFNVCYGRKGRIHCNVEVFGKKAHAAESELGVNAIEETARLIEAMRKTKMLSTPSNQKPSIVLHAMQSQTSSLSVPDRCNFQFSLLTPPRLVSKDILNKLTLLAKKEKVVVRVTTVKRKTPYSQSYRVDGRHKFIQQLEKEIFQPYNVVPMFSPSVADENVFANRLHIPVISLGPIGGGMHVRDEWVDLRSLQIVEDVYKRMLEMYNNQVVYNSR